MSTSPTSYPSWTKEENKAFENALAIYGDVDQWENVAAAVPGKTMEDIMLHYSALVHNANYASSSKSSGNAGDVSFSTGGTLTHQAIVSRNEEPPARLIGEKKKRKPFTDDEHLEFLEGLDRYGRGDWRSIAKYHVVTRTPTEVAWHARKFLKRVGNPNRKKRANPHPPANVAPGTSRMPPPPDHN